MSGSLMSLSKWSNDDQLGCMYSFACMSHVHQRHQETKLHDSIRIKCMPKSKIVKSSFSGRHEQKSLVEPIINRGV